MFETIAHVMGTRTAEEEVGPNAMQSEMAMASHGVMLNEAPVVTRREPGNIHGVRKLALVKVNKIILEMLVFCLFINCCIKLTF